MEGGNFVEGHPLAFQHSWVHYVLFFKNALIQYSYKPLKKKKNMEELLEQAPKTSEKTPTSLHT